MRTQRLTQLARMFAFSAIVLLSACQASTPKQPSAANPAAEAAAPSQAVASVDFYLGQVGPDANLTEVKLPQQVSIWVFPQAVMTRADLQEVQPVRNDQSQVYVRFFFNPEGAKKLAAITQNNIGALMLLSINRALISVSSIDDPMVNGVLSVPVEDEAQGLEIVNAILGGT